jgi:hypothetical protein
MSTTDQNQKNVTLKSSTSSKSVTTDASNIILPNQLDITINTGIPGFQKIIYKPSMTIKDLNSNDNYVAFNPLIKLNKSVVDKIPEQLRKKQFFNKALFDSLIRINQNTNSSPPAKNLMQATGYGYVDNNIKITLDTIFSEKSVIYISGKPYVIVDMQWTEGDRHIDIKGKKKIGQTIVKEEVVSGEEQLKRLDSSLIYGPNYTQNIDDGTVRGIKNASTSASTNASNTKPPPPPLPLSVTTTQNFKSFFKNPEFYTIINDVFKFGINKYGISKTVYDENVDKIEVIQNKGAGNCFFIAVEQAINNYNYINTDKKIVSRIYGDRLPFTQQYLRSLVYEYLSKNEEILDNAFVAAKVNVDKLNKLFKRELSLNLKALGKEFEKHPEIKPDVAKLYMKLSEILYKTNDNFLVQRRNDANASKKDFYPFKLLDRNRVKEYILSNDYWANQVAIDALCKELNLNVITIEKYKETLRIPFANLWNDQSCNDWNKFLFLYLEDNHYELLTFKYSENVSVSNNRFLITRNDSIFNKIEKSLPPIYILFIIYGYYASRKNKTGFNFQPDFMEEIDNVINNTIMKNSSIASRYNTLFKKYFPISYIAKPSTTGGKTRRNMYNMYNMYSKTKRNKSKDDKVVDKSQLAYYIKINLELYPGTTIPDDKFAHLKCNSKWNLVKKSYAELTGSKYSMSPFYNTLVTKIIENKKDTTEKKPDNNITEKKPDNNITEKKPDNPTEKKPDNPTEKKPDNPTEKKPDNPTEKKPDNPT